MKRKLAVFSIRIVMLTVSLVLLAIIATFLYWYRIIPHPLAVWDIKKSQDKPSIIYARTSSELLQIRKDDKWEDFFVKGVNIGAALPGKWFTQFPEDERVYLNWLGKIGQMNANTIRVYTLLPPKFYKALAKYNQNHLDKPLLLFQEIWPEENPPGHDYLREEYVQDYYREIGYALDAIHGRGYIPKRPGRAYGLYRTDVSEYLIGYLVGRELEAEEVIATDEMNPGFSFQGEYFSSAPGASPTEAWLAMNCDYVVKYAQDHYRTMHPVAIVSWPTLDVLEHDSEWNELGEKSLEFNDCASIDINNIICEPEMKAGLFGAYHIYPNYPDFMNNDIEYDEYYDEYGRLRYGGYLQEFMAVHQKYPALVAEFGISTSMDTAHISPDGMNHGGLNEEQQGQDIVRMMQVIQREGYAGGIIFEWMDEWAKKTWTTEPYMIPYERHVLWHNAIDPEQNYGLLAMEPERISRPYIETGSGAIKSISVNHDGAYIYIDLEFAAKPDLSQQKLIIGLDTYDRSRGEFRFNPQIDVPVPGGLEFIIDFKGPQDARILVHPGYNTARGQYSSYASSQGLFEEMRALVNKEKVDKNGNLIPALYTDNSQLIYGDFSSRAYEQWYWQGNTLYMRLPWGKINFTDPSSLMVLDDRSGITGPERDELEIVKTEGILVSALLYDIQKQEKIDLLNTLQAYKWQQWDNPVYNERLKKSYFIIQECFKDID